MLEIGKIYRMPRKPRNPSIKIADGIPNFFMKQRFLMRGRNLNFREVFMYLLK